MCEHPRWVPRVAQSPAIMGMEGLPNISTQATQSPPPVNVPFPLLLGISPGGGSRCPSPQEQAPTSLAPSAPSGCSHQPSRQLLTPLDQQRAPLLAEREARPRESGGTSQPGVGHPKPGQGNKRKEVAYLWRVAFVWFAETRRYP